LDGIQDRQIQSAKVQTVKVKPKRITGSARIDAGKTRA
jgi:hypothetical protein